MFESGMALDHKNKLYLLYKILNINQMKQLKHESFTFEKDNYDDITFDVIKRGPLLLLLIGLSMACMCFIFELIIYKFIDKYTL